MRRARGPQARLPGFGQGRRLRGARRALACAAVLAALSGCSSAPTSYYALAAIPGAAQPGGPPSVAVRTPDIAGYLDRNAIVRGGQDYRVDVASTQVWAEPLDGMIGRVLAEELAQRLPGTQVQPSSFGAGTPDATLQLNVQRFDAAADGTVTLLAQLAVQRGSDRTGDTRSVQLSAQAGSPGTASMVAAMSALLGRLADQAAGMLRGGGGGA